jgi:hypothetical protein
MARVDNDRATITPESRDRLGLESGAAAAFRFAVCLATDTLSCKGRMMDAVSVDNQSVSVPKQR